MFVTFEQKELADMKNYASRTSVPLSASSGTFIYRMVPVGIPTSNESISNFAAIASDDSLIWFHVSPSDDKLVVDFVSSGIHAGIGCLENLGDKNAQLLATAGVDGLVNIWRGNDHQIERKLRTR